MAFISMLRAQYERLQFASGGSHTASCVGRVFRGDRKGSPITLKLVQLAEDGTPTFEEASVDFVQETPENRIYRLSPRGRGCGNQDVCFRCYNAETVHDCACFVPSRETGEAIVRLFGRGAVLDYRDYEPDRVKVKVHACEDCLQPLNVLIREMTESQGVSFEMIQNAREETAPSWAPAPLPNLELIIGRLSEFVATHRASTLAGGGWPEVSGAELSAFMDIVTDLRDLKWARDCDGDAGIILQAVDRSRFMYFAMPIVPAYEKSDVDFAPLASAIEMFSGQISRVASRIRLESDRVRREREQEQTK